MTIDTERLHRLIDDVIADVRALRHDLHAHPELGYRETRTSARVRDALSTAGIEHHGGLAGGTGVIGLLPGRDETRAIALRADMDALPITETSGVQWASTHDGVMHACGHDGHTAMLVGAARVLAGYAATAPLPRPVVLLFQPAEEGGGGGRRMVEDGALDGSVVDARVTACYGLHGWPTLPLGRIAVHSGPVMAAVAVFDIRVRGRGCHAAMPHQGRDPILAATALVQSLQQIASRHVDPLESVVVSVTRIVGGTAFNVIPEEVVVQGTVRTLRAQVADVAREQVAAIASHIAAAHGCQVEIDYQEPYPSTVNDAAAVEVVTRAVRELDDGPARLRAHEAPSMTGEDFAFYGRSVPSCFFWLGLQAPGRDPMPGLHHPAFDFNDDALATGIEMFCRIALRDADAPHGSSAMAP